jgi:hypothetical protein
MVGRPSEAATETHSQQHVSLSGCCGKQKQRSNMTFVAEVLETLTARANPEKPDGMARYRMAAEQRLEVACTPR